MVVARGSGVSDRSHCCEEASGQFLCEPQEPRATTLLVGQFTKIARDQSHIVGRFSRGARFQLQALGLSARDAADRWWSDE
jgi:hypothetical protein